jgi:hypothetical protein
VKIALGRGAVIGGGNDSFPNQSLEVKDIHISDHSTFGHETTAIKVDLVSHYSGRRADKFRRDVAGSLSGESSEI